MTARERARLLRLLIDHDATDPAVLAREIEALFAKREAQVREDLVHARREIRFLVTGERR